MIMSRSMGALIFVVGVAALIGGIWQTREVAFSGPLLRQVVSALHLGGFVALTGTGALLMVRGGTAEGPLLWLTILLLFAASLLSLLSSGPP